MITIGSMMLSALNSPMYVLQFSNVPCVLQCMYSSDHYWQYALSIKLYQHALVMLQLNAERIKATNSDHWSTLKNTGHIGELENMH